MDAQIPAIPEKSLAVCGYRKFQGVVDQLDDLFLTTHKAKTHQVVKRRGHHCGDIELVGYLANATGPMTLVLDLRVTHDRVGSSDDPVLNGHLRYPNNLD
jgi:hypothetical protein